MRNYNHAFTLAEVLITLAIIGIVAALTIPTIINNYQKKTIITSLRNCYSTMVQGFKLSEIDNGPMEYWPENESLDISVFFTNYIKPYFKAEICQSLTTCGYTEDISSREFRTQWSNALWHPLTNNDGLLFQLSNGSIVFWTKNTYEEDWNIAYTKYIFIDVNGAKGPNTYCKDVFPFVRDNGSIRPRTNTCTEIIQNNSWNFPKDYSW